MSDPQSEEETQINEHNKETQNDEIPVAEYQEREVEESDAGQKVEEIPQPKKKRERKEPVELVRDPGKSFFPIARVQKIIKADKEIPIVAKEATFLISLATEEFIRRLCEASYRIAYREKRSTVQHKDIATVVRKAEEFLFLEEIMPWTLSEHPVKHPKAKATTGLKSGESTMLDHFVVGKKMETDQEDEGDIIMNEDGTMYAASNMEDDEL